MFYIAFAVCILLLLILFLITAYNYISDLFSLKEKLDSYKLTLNELELFNKSIDLNYSKLTNIYRKGTIPTNLEIGYDNLPKERNSETWGKSLTVFVSKNGRKIHTTPTCSDAYRKENIYNLRHRVHNDSMRNIDIRCKLCAIDFEIHNMEWYKYYQYYPSAVKTFKKLLSDREPLVQRALNIYTTYNSNSKLSFRLLRKKYNNELTNLNETYRLLTQKEWIVPVYNNY